MNQREIRFRVWGSWMGFAPSMMYDHHFHLTMDGKVMECRTGDPYDGSDTGDIEERNGLVVMQFTGLKDCNGKDVYEGDVLRISMQKDIQVNPFIVENLWDLRIGMESQDPYMRIDREVEIIGNIHENPELLTP